LYHHIHHLLPQPSRDARQLHSFPTRRSSDLVTANAATNLVPGSTLVNVASLNYTNLNGFLLPPRVTTWKEEAVQIRVVQRGDVQDRKSTRLNSSHVEISYAVFCLKKKKKYV